MKKITNKQFIINQLKKIGIIGAGGMLGSDLVGYLSKDYKITAITKDNYQSLISSTFDILINANGNSKRFWANENILEDFALSTVSVYKSIFDFPSELYIYISSSDVYENHSSKKFTKENQSINSSRLSPYGFHKYVSELIVQKNTKKHLILRSSMILGKNLKKGPLFDISQNQPLFIAKESRLQMITTKEISLIIKNLVKKDVYHRIFNMGGTGIVSFASIQKYFHQKIMFSQHAQKQEYEMDTNMLKKLYPLKTSQEYLQQYLASL